MRNLTVGSSFRVMMRISVPALPDSTNYGRKYNQEHPDSPGSLRLPFPKPLKLLLNQMG